MNIEIEELKQDISIFFKWYSCWLNYQTAISRKNSAVRCENFEMAVQYRELEKTALADWEDVNKQMVELASKYNDKAHT